MGAPKIITIALFSIMPVACLPPEINERELNQSMITSLACQYADVCINPKENQIPFVSFSPAPNLYNTDQTVTITSSASTICYSINSIAPTCNSLATCISPALTYGAPLSLSTQGNHLVQAIGCTENEPNTNLVSALYDIDKIAPSSVTSLSVTPNAALFKTDLSWTNPADSDLKAIRVLRKISGYSIDQTDGTIVTDSLTTSITDTGLSLNTRYYYSIYAYDNANNFSIVAQFPTILFGSNHCVDANNCIIFVTNAGYAGTFGTPANADSYCNIDSNKPNSSTYKAMIAFAAVRFPCKGGQDCTSAGDPTSMSDWVLYPNQSYKRPDGTSIGTTNSSGTFDSLTNAVDPSVSYAWTGMINGWAVNPAPNFTCANFTNSSQSGSVGKPDSTDKNAMMYYTFNSCAALMKFYCAEQ